MTPDDILLYSLISVLLSHFREYSSCSREQQVQRPSTRHYAESERSQNTYLKWNVSIKLLPSVLRVHCGIGSRKSAKIRGDGGY